MYCNNCGSLLNDNDSVCPNCQKVIHATVIDTGSENNTNNMNDSYEKHKENENNLEKYGFNKLLIFSILELICCFQLFGIIALILLLVQLKPAIEQGRFAEADKARDQVKTVLIVGLVLGLGIIFLNVILNIIPLIFAIGSGLY